MSEGAVPRRSVSMDQYPSAPLPGLYDALCDLADTVDYDPEELSGGNVCLSDDWFVLPLEVDCRLLNAPDLSFGHDEDSLEHFHLRLKTKERLKKKKPRSAFNLGQLCRSEDIPGDANVPRGARPARKHWTEREASSGCLGAQKSLKTQTTLQILRGGCLRWMPHSSLVVGDIIYTTKGCKLPCDARVLVCTDDCMVDMEPLNGEPRPQQRSNAMSDGSPLLASNVLLEGAYVVSGEAFALVQVIGDTWAQRIQASKDEAAADSARKKARSKQQPPSGKVQDEASTNVKQLRQLWRAEAARLFQGHRFLLQRTRDLAGLSNISAVVISCRLEDIALAAVHIDRLISLEFKVVIVSRLGADEEHELIESLSAKVMESLPEEMKAVAPTPLDEQESDKKAKASPDIMKKEKPRAGLSRAASKLRSKENTAKALAFGTTEAAPPGPPDATPITREAEMGSEEGSEEGTEDGDAGGHGYESFDDFADSDSDFSPAQLLEERKKFMTQSRLLYPITNLLGVARVWRDDPVDCVKALLEEGDRVMMVSDCRHVGDPHALRQASFGVTVLPKNNDSESKSDELPSQQQCVEASDAVVWHDDPDRDVERVNFAWMADVVVEVRKLLERHEMTDGKGGSTGGSCVVQ